jgi:iron complex transport system substrate-binding protein
MPTLLADPPVGGDGITRREFTAGAAATLLLAACGRDRTAAPAPGSAAAPRRVRDFFGTDVEIPAHPERIVAADDIALGNLLDLGVRPIATAVNLLSVPTFLGRRTDGIEDISVPDGIRLNVERLAALRPDVIFTIGVEFNREKYDALRAVAPTFGYAYGYASSQQIRTNMTELGRALGMEERAAAEVAKLDARVAHMRDRVAAAGLTYTPVSVLRVGPDFYSIRHGSTESVLLAELGIPRPLNQRSIEGFATRLSFENLAAVDAYALFVYVDTKGGPDYDRLRDNPLWPTLEVVRAGRVYQVESGVWNGISLPAAHAILDDIETTLLAGR